MLKICVLYLVHSFENKTKQKHAYCTTKRAAQLGLGPVTFGSWNVRKKGKSIGIVQADDKTLPYLKLYSSDKLYNRNMIQSFNKSQKVGL